MTLTEIRVSGFDLLKDTKLKQPCKELVKLIEHIPGIQLDHCAWSISPNKVETMTFGVRK